MRAISAKKLLSLAGVASASVFLSLPTWAVVSSNASNSNQHFRNYNAQTNPIASSQKLLAQSQSSPSGGSDMERSPSGGSDMERSPSGGSNTKPMPSGSGSSSPSSSGETKPTRSGSGSVEPLASGENSLKRGTWLCLHNPNPSCRE